MSADTPPPNATHSDVDFQDFEQARQIIAAAKKREMEALQEAERAKQALQQKEKEDEEKEQAKKRRKDEKRRRKEQEERKRKEEEERRRKEEEEERKRKEEEEERKRKEEEEERKRKEEEEERKRKEEEEQKRKKAEVEKKLQERKQANDNIIAAQSQTISLIKPILQHFSPKWFDDLNKFITDFLLLNDGHILFSRTWLKNDSTVLSTPLLFRPIYNVVLYPVLRFICDYHLPESRREHPGAAFYIAGDQGIGKTSLMLILMSTLSHRSLDFHYEKGFKGGKPQHFVYSENPDGSYSLNDLRDDRSRLDKLFIHIHDDCPPPATIKPDHLYIIFTSPDPQRLPIPAEEQNNHLCHIFRLPTFSLAEDAVAMVGCTPTAPFALLSPEDMQLRTKDQRILLSLEIHKEDLAWNLSFQTERDPIPSNREAVKMLLLIFCDVIKDISTRWNDFEKTFRNYIMDKTTQNKKQEQIQALKYLFPKPEPSEPANQAGQVTPEPIDSGDAARTEQKSKKARRKAQRTPPSTPNSTFNPTPPPFNQPGHITLQTDVTTTTVTDSNEEPTPSVLTVEQFRSDIKARFGPKSLKAPVDSDAQQKRKDDPVKKDAKRKRKKGAVITDAKRKEEEDAKTHNLYMSLCGLLFESREIPERERIVTVVDWLMEQLEIPSGRSQEQVFFIKGLIHKLVLFEWNQSNQKNQDAQNAEAITTASITQNEGAEAAPTGVNAQIPKTLEKAAGFQKEKDEEEIEQERTDILFATAMAYTLPPPDIVGEIQKFSNLIEQVKLTDPQTSPSPEDIATLPLRLASLKKHFEASDVFEDANRQKVRDEVTRVKKQIGLEPKERIKLLFTTLIDMLITLPSYDSHKQLLPSLFVLPDEKEVTTDTNIGNNLRELLTQSRNQSDQHPLDFIVSELIQYLRYSQMKANPPISAQSDLNTTPPISAHSDLNTTRPKSALPFLSFDKRKMARIACDLLITIVNPLISLVAPPLNTVEMRLRSVKREIERIQGRFSFLSLMDAFYFIARDMNILVTPHSILKGLSERPEQPALDLNLERMNVYYRNLSDGGLNNWIKKATSTLLPRPVPTKTPPLEEIQLSIRNNLNIIITQFNDHHPPSKSSVDHSSDSPLTKKEEEVKTVINRKWLPIVRSMMNTILYLIDAGTPRHMIFEEFEGLRDLLTTVYKSNEDHLLRVADQQLNQNCEESKSDYVNDWTIFTTHFGPSKSRAPDGSISEKTKKDFKLESLRTLKLPRTLQLTPVSQDRLERMTIALFARNLLYFLQLENGFRFDDDSCVERFYTEFLQEMNPGDIVHRSFVDFMNLTNLLSQKNFGVTPEKFPEFLEKEHPKVITEKDTVQTTRRTRSLVTIMTERIKLDSEDPDQPFKDFRTKQYGVHFLLWASTDLLLKATRGVVSQESKPMITEHSLDEAQPSDESGDEKTISRLNVPRASIFGPSPRWLTSTDARTNRGLVFLWDGVLDNENVEELTKVADSNHSRIMEFNTPLIFFEKTLNAAWDDISALVPLLPNYRTKEKRPSLLKSAFSLIFKKTAATIMQMQSQIPFVAVSPFVELILQSEVVSALARLMTQDRYDTFKNNQTIHGFKLPPYVEEPLVCISFLLNCPTPIRFSTTTSFTEMHFCSETSRFWSHYPAMETETTEVTKMPMLTFPNLSNQSVHGTKFPKSLIQTGRGETHFYAEDLQEVTGGNLPGLGSLIVSRGSSATSETIFMVIQATRSESHSLVDEGITLIQQLLFQAMCHLEPSEGIVAMYNYATTQEDPTFPPLTGILGFHAVSSYLKFDKNTLTHMSSIFRHRDRPFVSNPTESQSTITTRFITNTLLANLPQYPTLSETFDPWKTSLLDEKILSNSNFILPYRWKVLYDLFWKPSTDGSTCEGTSPQITADKKNAKDWLDRMVRRTMQELLRIGMVPDDLGKSVAHQIKTFSSFVLCTTISCRRNELLNPPTTSDPREDDHSFVNLVQSIVGTPESQSIKHILSSLTGQTSTMTKSIRDEQLKQLDDLCRENCIQKRLYPVYHAMTNNAMKRLRNPVQECLSVIQSTYDNGVFRVPTRNNLSAILHCGTVLLDNISPLPGHSITPSPTTDNSSTPTPHSQNVSSSQPRSRTLRIPLHSFILAKYGFSNSIPSLCDLTQDDVRKEVTNVTPSPLIRWHPRRVVIDPSLFSSDIQQEDSLSFFTTFIHRLFADPFIPVTTSFTTYDLNRSGDNEVLLTQIQKIKDFLDSVISQRKLDDPEIINDDELQDKPNGSEVKETTDKLEGLKIQNDGESQKTHIKPSIGKYKGLEDKVTTLSNILTQKQASSVISLLPEIQDYPRIFQLSNVQRGVIQPAIEEIESIEAIGQQPTLVFVKAGNDILPPSTDKPQIIVDRKTKAHHFPIPFSTGYKEGELREEMKQIYESLTDLLPKRFTKEHLSLSPPLDEPNKEQIDSSPSKKEAESKARPMVGSTILRTAETSTTPLFVFVVDEDLADHESLPMSLHSANGNVDFGVMRQRSLADALWILFLTRISREVMALSLNTSLKPNDITEYVIKFISQVLMDEKQIGKKDTEDCSTIFDTLISLVNSEGLDNLNEHPSIGIELLVSAYPHLLHDTSVISLSRLLMMCKSTPKGETRLNTLLNTGSPPNELDLLTRWFELLSSSIAKNGFEVAIKSDGFTTDNIRSNLLTAFYQIIEPELKDERPLVEQLATTIDVILNAGTQQFFKNYHEQTLLDFKDLTNERMAKIKNPKDPRRINLNQVYVLIDNILRSIQPAANRALKSRTSSPPN
ncbi:hypothetical protein BLNAU_14747 [Blattamonas nauphoetae]|uniref:Uncharacterized protein n=1 Tax=Blattamonas nauphoetae TaxID=2049346 RepID=A0ABQ9XJ94_9EUKA|nr:hypothetical protein BLNAU_14747 [Blattamonas nauphoetae]